jgi:hypothetical protein
MKLLVKRIIPDAALVINKEILLFHGVLKICSLIYQKIPLQCFLFFLFSFDCFLEGRGELVALQTLSVEVFKQVFEVVESWALLATLIVLNLDTNIQIVIDQVLDVDFIKFILLHCRNITEPTS